MVKHRIKRFSVLFLLSCYLSSEVLSTVAYASGMGGGGAAVAAPVGSGGSGGGGNYHPSHTFAQGVRVGITNFGSLMQFTNGPDIRSAASSGQQLPAPQFSRQTADKIFQKRSALASTMTGHYYTSCADLAGQTIHMYDRFNGGFFPETINANSISINVQGENQTLLDYLPPVAVLDNSSGAALSASITNQFGDANGKLTSIVTALATARAKIAATSGLSGLVGGDDSDDESGGSGSLGGSGGTGATGVETVANGASDVQLLGFDEVIEQYKHYMDWWDVVYTYFGGIPSDCVQMDEIRANFERAVEASKRAKDSASGSGHGGSSSVSMGDEVFQDWMYMSERVHDYPCVVIEQFTACLTVSGSVPRGWVAITWQDFNSSGQSGWGVPEIGFMQDSNKEQYPMRGNLQQAAIRSCGYIYEERILNEGDFAMTVPFWTMNPYEGYLFYGFYGALPTASGIPDDDPEDPGDPPPTIPVTNTAADVGTYYLMDYEMNHIFDSMAEHYSDSIEHNHARLNPGIHTTDPSQYSDCGHGNNDYDTTTYSSIRYTEEAGSGPSIEMDNAGPTKLYLHNNGVKGNTWWLRDEIKASQVIDSGSSGDYVIDYGFNLVRKNFNDARAYSKIIAQDVNKDYLEKTLGMYEGIITNNPTKITDTRNSEAVVGPVAGIKDSLFWFGVFEQTNSSTEYETYSRSHTYSCGSSSHPRTCTCHYNGSRQVGGIKAFDTCKGQTTNYSVDMFSIAHKYQTIPIPTGYSQPKDIQPFDYRPTTEGDGSHDDNQYRGSNTIDPGTEVTYVPEVPMIADEVPGPELEHHPKKVTTVGEEARKSKLILMTLYRVTGASNPVKGVVYSDTAVGGDAGLSSQTRSGRLALTAGGDFTVKADTNMQVNLYGYALDLIEPGDAGYDTVTLGNDVKAGWGNSGSRTALMNKYQEWAAAMLNPKNYQADFEMAIGTKEYNSFSATVGSFSSKASQSTETGQYNIHVKHGKIEDDAGYRAFISQLASDYGCSEGEAETLFTNSDMASAIIKAIEHDNSSANKSLPAKYVLAPGEIGTFNEPDLSSMLGNASHWYDEEVRVFVIRRFMTPAAKVTNIIAQDKMDIGNSMEVLGGDKMGHFKLNVWFRNSCYTRAVQEYIPNTNGDNKAQAISAGDLIIAGVDVNGADFNITNATTATGKH